MKTKDFDKKFNEEKSILNDSGYALYSTNHMV